MFNALIQSGTESGGGMPAANLGVSLVLTVVFIASNWRVFSKAGEPGWAAIVPIYKILVLLRIAGKPAWWIILLIIPVANLIAGIIVSVALARRFGKGTGFGVGLALLPMIFFPILGFGSSQLTGAPAGAAVY
jgi:Family of unknown function (DUF5684)